MAAPLPAPALWPLSIPHPLHPPHPDPLQVHSLLDEAQTDMRWAAAGTLETAIVDVSSFYELRVS